HTRRGAPVPLAALRALGGESARRRVLVEKAIVADAVARGLCRFDAELAAGRLPLTSEDLERLRVAPTDLAQAPAADALRRAVAEQVVWARALLAVAWALPHDLGPRHAPWAGGWLRRIEARLRAVERIGFDVTGRRAEPRPTALDRAALLGALWWLPPRSVVDHGGG
ncbi:MAG: squalene/phytoene synthase family protein, partial [Planctomycetota bacterium]